MSAFFTPKFLTSIVNTYYKIPEEQNYNCIDFINITNYSKPIGSATGGPQGVLYVLENLSKKTYCDFPVRFIYSNGQPNPLWNSFFKRHNLSAMTKLRLAGAYQVLHGRFPKPHVDVLVDPQHLTYLICQDHGVALGSYLSGLPYSIVCHQQGSLFAERTSFGETISELDHQIMDEIEKLVFYNAERVYFPSLGARQALMETSDHLDLSKISFADKPLYNTILDFPIDHENAKKFILEHGYRELLDREKRKKYIVFVSIADYSHAKGHDRVPPFLQRLSQETSKSILWIVLGSAHKAGIYENLKGQQEGFSFKSIFIPKRLPHDLTMGILQYADWFLGLHRRSIFDFSNLEAMKLGKGLILSPVGGNLELDTASNVLFVDPEEKEMKLSEDLIKLILSEEGQKDYSNRNLKAFEDSFSNKHFLKRYISVYDEIIDKYVKKPYKRQIETDDLRQHFPAIKGSEVIICGPGSSLNSLKAEEYQDKILVSINRALISGLPFNFHIQQDDIQDEDFKNIEYKNDNIIRFFGIIGRKIIHPLQNDAVKTRQVDFCLYNNYNIKYYNYYLLPVLFDEQTSLNIDHEWPFIYDMRSVLFSAMQIFAHLGVRSIELAGIDFSKNNFNGPNPADYNPAVLTNLRLLTRNLREKGVIVKVLHSTSLAVYKAVEDVDYQDTTLDNNSAIIINTVRKKMPPKIIKSSTLGKKYFRIIRSLLYKISPTYRDIQTIKNTQSGLKK